MCVRNCLGVDSALDVVFNPLDSLKDAIGRKVREFLYAAVSDDGGVVVLVIPEKANFYDREVTA